ncbi:hypothetical protein VPH166E361_0095 [Vibrio phage 166E36-1]
MPDDFIINLLFLFKVELFCSDGVYLNNLTFKVNTNFQNNLFNFSIILLLTI